MAAKPWYTSSDLIEAVKRKISFPIYQTTFSEDDILAFANEEMQISQVPSILQYHQEYFVFYKDVYLNAISSRYSIPSRAIGMRIRDVSYRDTNGNLFEMTRIMAEDKTFFNRNVSNSTNVHKYYLEGNDIVLTPEITSIPTGNIRMYFFLRPNQLVQNDRAAIIQNFAQPLTIIDNTTIQPESSNIVIQGLSFTPVSSSPVASAGEFLIGVDADTTATNMATVMNTILAPLNIMATSTNNVVNLLSSGPTINMTFGDITSYQTSQNQELICTAPIPDNIVGGSLVDLLQTLPGHKTYTYDVVVPQGGVSGNSIFLPTSVLFPVDPVSFASADLQINMVVGDYVCSANESIIPQIPPDLHNGLAERTCARILEAIGDQQGLQTINAKIQDIQVREGNLLDDRTEGSALKVTGRHSLLRYLGVGSRRRL